MPENRRSFDCPGPAIALYSASARPAPQSPSYRTGRRIPGGPYLSTQSPTSSHSYDTSASLRTLRPQASNTTPAASVSSPTSRARPRTISSRRASISCSTSCIAAPCGCDPLTGDGAGIILQVPHAFFRHECEARGHRAAGAGQVRRRLCLLAARSQGAPPLPADPRRQDLRHRPAPDRLARRAPSTRACSARMARESAPVIRQVFIGSTCDDEPTFERKLFVIRKWAERTVRETQPRGQGLASTSRASRRARSSTRACCSPSSSRSFYVELEDETMVSALAMVHQRFSTNTFPTWELAQPFRMLAHNGEINTLRGNAAWMRAREQLFDGRSLRRRRAPHPADHHARAAATRRCSTTSPSCSLHAGRSLPHVMMMLVPEAWQNDELMPAAQEGLLRVPLVPDRAVGRPRRARLHRRQAHRRHARPQRPAPRALHDHQGRPGRDALGDRRARHSRPRTSSARAGSSRAACSWSIPSRVASSRTKRSRTRSAAGQAVRQVAARQQDLARRASTTSPPTATEREYASLVQRQKMFGYTQEDLQLLDGADGREGRRAARLDGHRHAARRAQRSRRSCCSTTSSSTSRRSPTPRSTRSAKSW